jgi:hypothetical protein
MYAKPTENGINPGREKKKENGKLDKVVKI